MKTNIILIGMPGCGKSTCGVLLAKLMLKSFLDTDLLIQQNEGKKLQDIINEKGNDYFKKCENDSVVTLYAQNCVIATGGSMVYNEEAMKHLKELGYVVYLRLGFNSMKKRINNLATRGILLKEGYTLEDMYNERAPLYEKYADITVNCDRNSINDTVEAIIKNLKSIK
ncbi:MAG: shikimate kinase [Acutalibacteraceae bacterium]|nr:shikimate kinase [Acutalibacteraceae bacterium]